MRGNQSASPVRCYVHGSIPACAGEPGRLAGSLLRPRVYPRVCGGTGRPCFLKNWIGGLSPRVRGNLEYSGAGIVSRGSIPACAGEPEPGTSPRSQAGVYPRVCGGTRAAQRQGGQIAGLSPRVRGNPRRIFGEPVLVRSIPACAGEPVSATVLNASARVYPRVCGGTDEAKNAIDEYKGLSPRVRGNLAGFAFLDAHMGSIPACAGEPP